MYLTVRGDVGIPHSIISNTNRVMLVRLILDVCGESEKIISSSCVWCQIDIFYKKRSPSQFCEMPVMITNCATNTSRCLCDIL